MAEVLYTWAKFYTLTIEVVVALRQFTLPLSSSRGSLQKSEVHQHCRNYGSLQAFSLRITNRLSASSER